MDHELKSLFLKSKVYLPSCPDTEISVSIKYRGTSCITGYGDMIWTYTIVVHEGQPLTYSLSHVVQELQSSKCLAGDGSKQMCYIVSFKDGNCIYGIGLCCPGLSEQSTVLP